MINHNTRLYQPLMSIFQFGSLGLSSKGPKNSYDAVVVGGGPAGLTAALYIARYGLSVAVLEAKNAGGYMNDIHIIENYPAYEGSGEDLAKKFINQAKKRGAEIYEMTPVRNISGEPGAFRVQTPTKIVNAKAVVIATGTEHRRHPLVNKASYCATCDAPLYKGKKVAVIGGGNTAAHEAMVLSEVASEVVVIHRSPFKAEKALLDRLLSRDNVRDILGTIEKVEEKGKSRFWIRSGEEKIVEEFDGVFVAIGLVPVSPKTKWDQEIKDDRGYIKVDITMRTPVKFIYAAGDITGYSGQVVVAAGQGASAAMSLYEDLSKSS